MNKPTPGKWKRSCEIIEDEEGKTLAICSGHDTSLEQDEANANFVLTAHEACFAVNPSNPLAVAEALPELVAAAKELMEKFTEAKERGYSMSARQGEALYAALAKVGAK